MGWHRWWIWAAYSTFAAGDVLLQAHFWPRHIQNSETLDLSIAGLNLLRLLLAGAAVGAIARWTSAPVASGQAGAGASRRPPLASNAGWMAVALACLALFFLTSLYVLERFANSGDEFAYLWQAAALRDGRLSYEAPPLGHTFVALRTWVVGGRWMGQYPPGWPLVIAAGDLLGLPVWVVNPLLGAAMLAALAALIRRHTSPSTALTLTAVCAATPFVVFNAASYFSHVVTALLVLAFVAAAERYLRLGSPRAALLAGAVLGAMGLVRIYPALLLIALLGAWLLVVRGRVTRTDALIALGGLPFLAALLAYQGLVMGNPLVSTYAADYQAIEAVRRIPDVTVTLRLLQELAAWTSPVLLAVYAAALVVKARARALEFYDFIPGLFVLAHVVPGWDGGNRYGPRYYFDAYPVVFLTIAGAIPIVRGWGWPRFEFLAPHVATACILHGFITYPFAAALFHRIVVERQDVERLAAENGLEHAVVVIRSAAGVISPMQPFDLARNEPGLDASVLYARGDAASIDDIRRTFPERSVWIYERARESARGTLRLVR